VIDWGDGRVDAVHTYAAPGTYTVSVLVPGSSVAQTFTFVVTDISKPPVLTLVGDQLSLNDSGVSAQPFEYTINWGDDTSGNKSVEQRVTLMLKTPSGGPFIATQTTVTSSVKSTGPGTLGSFDIQHRYLGSPNPNNPAADIPISVQVIDDNNDLDSASITVKNPGINTSNVAIDTTPDVPRLALIPQAPLPVLLNQQSAAPSSLQPTVAHVSRSELTTTSERYFELVVVTQDGNEDERYVLKDEALVDLRQLFATLPDNRYKIYLSRTDSNSHRLVVDVFVRNGRVVDRSDDTEGIRDRPPTAEGGQQNNAQQNNVPQNNGQPIVAPQQQVVPLQNNPLLNRLPDEKKGAANELGLPAIGPANGAVQAPVPELSDTQPTRSRASMRWALPLAGLGLVASRESWSERLGAALETADDGAWQRLRRAGRLGKSSRKSPAGQEKQPATTHNPS
jgi:hypothetical protein